MSVNCEKDISYAKEENGVFSYDTIITSLSLDCFYKTHPDMLIALHEDVAGLHCWAHHVAVPELQRVYNKSWVIVSLELNIFQAPSWGEKVRLSTKAFKPVGMFFPRITTIEDLSGKILSSMRSTWGVYDFKEKRLSRSEEIENLLDIKEKCTTKDVFFMNRKNLDFSVVYVKTEHEAGNYDCDINMHVNNISYLKWVLSALNKEDFERRVFYKVEMFFQKQMFIQDKAEIVIVKNEMENGYEYVANISDSVYIKLYSRKEM